MSVCTLCSALRSKVLETRTTDRGWVRRRRRCFDCEHRWNTLEVPEDILTIDYETETDIQEEE
jgi:transcriptional regulator NrdR family protein